MSEPLDEVYLRWLYSQVGSVKLRNRSRTYWVLLRQLYKTEFVWIVPNDDNRVEDGRDLRDEFIFDERIEEVPQEWLELGCSVLEMLIGLSRHLSFEGEGEVRFWFWRLIENLELDNATDRHPYPDEVVAEITYGLINRTYDPDGQGGLFPLTNPQQDQTQVELWYQKEAYLLEREEGNGFLPD